MQVNKGITGEPEPCLNTEIPTPDAKSIWYLLNSFASSQVSPSSPVSTTSTDSPLLQSETPPPSPTATAESLPGISWDETHKQIFISADESESFGNYPRHRHPVSLHPEISVYIVLPLPLMDALKRLKRLKYLKYGTSTLGEVVSTLTRVAFWGPRLGDVALTQTICDECYSVLHTGIKSWARLIRSSEVNTHPLIFLLSHMGEVMVGTPMIGIVVDEKTNAAFVEISYNTVRSYILATLSLALKCFDYEGSMS